MNSIKCKKCSTSNFSDAVVCARCGTYLLRISDEKEKPKLRFSFAALLAFAALGAILYYIYGGIKESINEVGAQEIHRTGSQPKPTTSGLSRSEADRQRSAQFGNAVKNSNSLSESHKHNEQIQKMTQAPKK